MFITYIATFEIPIGTYQVIIISRNCLVISHFSLVSPSFLSDTIDNKKRERQGNYSLNLCSCFPAAISSLKLLSTTSINIYSNEGEILLEKTFSALVKLPPPLLLYWRLDTWFISSITVVKAKLKQTPACRKLPYLSNLAVLLVCFCFVFRDICALREHENIVGTTCAAYRLDLSL